MDPTTHALYPQAAGRSQRALHLVTAPEERVVHERRGRTQVVRLSISTDELHALGVPGDRSLRLSVEARTSWLRRPIAAPQADVHRVEVESGAADDLRDGDHVMGHRFTKQPITSLPWSYDLVRGGGEVEEGAGLEWDDLMFEIDEGRVPNHQFLGHAAPVQLDVWGSVRSDLAAADDGARLRQFETEPHRMLLQIEAEPVAPSEIGDLGRLYVLIPEDDLLERRFDRTIACVQSS